MSHVQTPSISLVAYDAWPKGMVFVRVPNERGRFVLTDRSVVEVPCPACDTAKGEPCKNTNLGYDLYWSGTHADRRNKAIIFRRVNNIRTRPKPVVRFSDLSPPDPPMER